MHDDPKVGRQVMKTDPEMDANYCAMPRCSRERANGMSLPICANHARRVYMEAQGLIELARRILPAETAAGPSKSTRAMRNALDQPGRVYFMLMEEGVVKVGFSTNVHRRAKSLRPQEILGHFPGTRRDERALHAQLGPHWIDGECFTDCAEVRQVLAERMAQAA